MRSRRASCSAESVISSARRLPVSCSIVRGPMIGAVTAGLASSQASATSAGDSPSSRQRPSYVSSCARYLSTLFWRRSLARRPSFAFWSAPPSRPPASGLHGITPTPCAPDVVRGGPRVVRRLAHRGIDLGGEDDRLAAAAALREPAADDLLGDALAAAPAVDVGRVEEVDAGLARAVHEREAVALAGE